jgi:hypothetical protein
MFHDRPWDGFFSARLPGKAMWENDQNKWWRRRVMESLHLMIFAAFAVRISLGGSIQCEF